MKIFASRWSPPTWMKFPKAYNNGTLIMKKEILKAYALYFKKFIEAYKAEGIDINQIHIQNEPFADQKFPSCLWTGSSLAFENPNGEIVIIVSNDMDVERKFTFKDKDKEYSIRLKPYSFNTIVY